MGKRPKSKEPESRKPQISRLHEPLTLSFKHYDTKTNRFCLSECERQQLRDVADALRQLTTLTFQQVLQQGGRGENKVGLAYTPYLDSSLNKVTRPATISPDITIAGIRASQGGRVFGAYINHVFYVLWFDRGHDIVPA
jgi:hypothetical protein